MSEQNTEEIEKGESGEYSRILREILQQENLQSDEDLARALAKYSQTYYAPPKGTSNATILETIFEVARKIRVYIVSQLVDYLYGQNEPASLIEIGSAGDITAAMALPQTQVTSLDDDPNIFLNVPNNSLPKEVFKRLGMKKTIAGYGGDNFWRGKKRKLALVEKCLPNWHKSIEDARRIPFPNSSFDIALVQGPLEIGDFIKEMARVVKPSGHIITILDEDNKEMGSPSAYETNRYSEYPDIPMVNLQQAGSLGLQRKEIPDRFRRYENMATWRDEDGKPKAAGIVFQVFKKD